MFSNVFMMKTQIVRSSIRSVAGSAPIRPHRKALRLAADVLAFAHAVAAKKHSVHLDCSKHLRKKDVCVSLVRWCGCRRSPKPLHKMYRAFANISHLPLIPYSVSLNAIAGATFWSL